jgi:hypothetical protein
MDAVRIGRPDWTPDPTAMRLSAAIRCTGGVVEPWPPTSGVVAIRLPVDGGVVI